LTAIGVGGSLGGIATVLGFATLPLVTGVIGVVFGAAYLASPTWRFVVVTDDTGLEVRARGLTRFRVAWGDIVRVVASPSTHTCFLDGGSPDKSLLVPGVGAPAPYDLERRDELFDEILARVPPDRVKTVTSLDA